ncbi:hypothetical protein WJX81_007238 [Elliptochloris bilobata]|uniref:Uncharacterized protein n=1 Tax=Elliptochloris bilobata TaxID=381761 RepID=A0AAW1RKS8_9CHLO
MTHRDSDLELPDSEDEDAQAHSAGEECEEAATTSGRGIAEQDGDEDSPTQDQLRERKAANIRALLDNSLQVSRKALLPKVLSVQGAELALRAPFKSPHPNAPARSEALQRKLMKRRVFVPWGSKKSLSVFTPLPTPPPAAQPAVEADEGPEPEPLVLWEPPKGDEGTPVAVDRMLTKWLRPHQREGVAFMFECVAGLRKFDGHGCILADDMGLGKTLQGITLLWTLLQSGHALLGGLPLAKRVIICCPTSLVNNWDSECIKWLKGRVCTLPLCESSREDVVQSIAQFLSPRNPFQVLIVSYETFRLHAEKFRGEGACDLLICDEAHRLKNDQTLTNKALDSLACRRRVLLSGTPMQNHLDEFYAMVSFTNPGVLGAPSQFRRHFEAPILAGREPDADDATQARGAERSAELSAIVNDFILRRTNTLLSAHLPPKVVEVVCCRMTEMQAGLYTHFLTSNAARRLLSGQKAARVLSAITALKKLCNHPKLIYDAMHARSAGGGESGSGKEGGGGPDGFEDCGRFFPPGLFDDGRPGRGRAAWPPGWPALSGKFAVLAAMLERLRPTGDRIVIVSNYTQTLDLFSQLCRDRGYPVLKLDGSTTINKRQKLVKLFNDPAERQFVFLLSSKAGGCGLNLIGGNRLVLFDPDWNPANDKQAAARVWRDGQKKRVFVYRFLATGTIEEKVFQRQLSKEGLQTVVNNSGKAGDASGSGGGAAAESAGMSANLMSAEELRDLFSLRQHTLSDTYDSMCGDDGDGGGSGNEGGSCVEVCRAQVGAPAEEDLQSWGQHSSTETVPDEVMRYIGCQLPGVVSFVFSCQVDGKPLEHEAPLAPLAASTPPPIRPQLAAYTPAGTPALARPEDPAEKPRGAASTPGLRGISLVERGSQGAMSAPMTRQPLAALNVQRSEPLGAGSAAKRGRGVGNPTGPSPPSSEGCAAKRTRGGVDPAGLVTLSPVAAGTWPDSDDNDDAFVH